MAETVKKGARITGADRAKLAGETTLSDAVDIGEVLDEAGPVLDDAAREESGREG